MRRRLDGNRRVGRGPFRGRRSLGSARSSRRQSGPATAAQASQDSASPRALLDRYCVTCHNERLKTGGLSLDTVDPPTSARARRRLGEGRPQAARGHDAAGRPARGPRTGRGVAASPRSRPGSIARPRRSRIPAAPPLHRLNRTEYANAIRDLLALDIDVRDAAAGRRHRRARLRQHRRRAVGLAGAARALPVGGAQDQPARGRGPDRSRRRDVSAADGCWCRTIG